MSVKLRELRAVRYTSKLAASRYAPEEDRARPGPARNVAAPLSGPERQIYLELDDDDGLTGRYGPVSQVAAFVAITELRPCLIGRPAVPDPELWRAMANVDYAGRRGEFIGAVGAVDCALWDLRGRREHRPVWELLGGRQRDTVPAYASMMDFSTEPQALHERAQEAREAGFHAQKWFVRCGPADGEAGVARNLAQFDALRNSLGDNYPLMLDAWTAWDLPFAEQMCIGLRNHRLEWIEEPLPADDLEAHVELKARTGVRIASGEHLFTRAELNPYLKARVLDVAQFDIAWTGGITEALEACKAVAAGGLTAIPHGSSLAATLHFVFAQPAALCPSISYVSRIAARAEALLTPQPVPREGAFTPPMGPGLGIDIEPGKVASSETLQWS